MVDRKCEEAQTEIVVDPDVRKVNNQVEYQPKKTKDHCCQDEDEHLAAYIHDFSKVLVFLVLRLLVHVIKGQSQHVDRPTCKSCLGTLSLVVNSKAHNTSQTLLCATFQLSSVVIQLSVYFVKYLFKSISFGHLHHVGIYQLEGVFDR